LPDKPRTWKAKGNAQEAHEAIRATHVEVEEAGETEEHRALYRLIRLRALASQLADAVHAVVALRLGANIEDKQAVFEAKGRRLIDSGWKSLNAVAEDEGDEAAQMNNPVSGSAIRSPFLSPL
jgi:DNA topoisomerase-1